MAWTPFVPWIRVKTTKKVPSLASDMEMGKPRDWSRGKRKVQYSDRVRNPAVACAISSCSIAGMDDSELGPPRIMAVLATSWSSERRIDCSLCSFSLSADTTRSRSVWPLAVKDNESASLKARLCCATTKSGVRRTVGIWSERNEAALDTA